MAPVLDPVGINPGMSVILLFGFVAREMVIGALIAMSVDAMRYEMGNMGQSMRPMNFMNNFMPW